MHFTYSAMMIAVIVIGLASVGFARGRWDAPLWLVVATALVVLPLTSAWLARAEGAPEGLLRWAFQVAVSSLVSTCCSARCSTRSDSVPDGSFPPDRTPLIRPLRPRPESRPTPHRDSPARPEGRARKVVPGRSCPHGRAGQKPRGVGVVV
jgi:hypothetical protein